MYILYFPITGDGGAGGEGGQEGHLCLIHLDGAIDLRQTNKKGDTIMYLNLCHFSLFENLKTKTVRF